jgi:hypothetical protein
MIVSSVGKGVESGIGANDGNSSNKQWNRGKEKRREKKESERGMSRLTRLSIEKLVILEDAYRLPLLFKSRTTLLVA